MTKKTKTEKVYTIKEKDLIKKYETQKTEKRNADYKMYVSQTDRNFKDGDRN